MLRRPPATSLFSYTTLFRSTARAVAIEAADRHVVAGVADDRDVGKGPGDHRTVTGEAPGHTLVGAGDRSEEHTSELQSRRDLVCRLLYEIKKRLLRWHRKVI